MKLLPFTLTLLLTFLFLGCNSDKETLQVGTNLTAYSEDVVELQASGALAYSWRQISGTPVIVINANSATPSFIAPDVSSEETLVFELEAVTVQIQGENTTLKKQVSVIVQPKATVDTGSTSQEAKLEQQEEPQEENDVAESTDTLPASQEEVAEVSSTDMNSTSGEVEAEEAEQEQVAEVVNSTSKEVELEEQTYETNTSTNETNTTQPTVSLKSLKLTLEKNSLNVDTNTTLKVVATYSDNTTKDVTNQVEWIYTDKLAIDIKNKTLKTFHKDTNIFLQAKYKNKTSNSVALEIYKEINGHRLPPEPNPAINNATLLGVDSNDNGVRDDVERWVYQEYKEKHPVHIDIAMQAGRAYKKVLETPERALEIHDEVRAFRHCQAYYSVYAKYFNEPVVVHENIYSRYFRHKIYFNTQERMDAYLQYDKLLSGGVYTLPEMDELKAKCDFNTTKYEE